MNESKRVDHYGVKYNKLTAIKPLYSKNGARVWLFECECGKLCELVASQVKYGKVRSCGCNKHKLSKGEGSFNDLFRKYKKGALSRGYTFDLTKDEFRLLTSKECYYCGDLPYQVHQHSGCHGAYTYNGIDRVDNAIGYIYENCVPCCFVCNGMKSKLDKETFIKKILQIAKRSV